MPIRNEDLRKLQLVWYQILADHGFKDIEKLVGGKAVLINGASTDLVKLDASERNSREEYYRFIGHKVNDGETVFRSAEDEFIMNRYADGAKIKTITDELLFIGISRERKTIRIIIRRYEKEWKIRSYSRKQLNLK